VVPTRDERGKKKGGPRLRWDEKGNRKLSTERGGIGTLKGKYNGAPSRPEKKGEVQQHKRPLEMNGSSKRQCRRRFTGEQGVHEG